MALYSKCPREALKADGRLVPGRPLPELQHWADVAFVAYKEQCKLDGKPVTGLARVFRCEIKNEKTLEVVRAICAEIAGMARGMNTTTFDAGSAQGNALIATPNGAGVAWVLLRHRERLGKKVIKRVILMANPEYLSGEGKYLDGPHLCFEVADGE